MLPYNQMALAMGALRDQLIATIRMHERKAHDGAPCMGNRASAIAYLAHCIGIRGSNAWSAVGDMSRDYDARCTDGGDCLHPTGD